MMEISEKLHEEIAATIGYETDYSKYLELIEKHTKVHKDFGLVEEGIQVLCVVKNGGYYLESFLAHYRKLGVSRFVFLDNGSTDNTLTTLENESDVKVISNHLPYRTFWHHFKRYLFEYFGKNYWNLVVDIDELIDFPGSEEYALYQVLKYCDDHQYTSVMCQMLDLYPDEDVLSQDRSSDFIETHVGYNTENLKYLSPQEMTGTANRISNYSIKYQLGGWRDATFKTGDIMLTKHAIVKGESRVKYVHDHFVYGAHVADFSCVLKHYKFNNNFRHYVSQSISEKNHYNNSAEYVRYQGIIDQQETLNFFSSKTEKYSSALNLVTQNFVQLSAKFISNFDKIPRSDEIMMLAYQGDNESLIVERDLLTKRALKIEQSWSYRIGYFITRVFVPIYWITKKS